MNNELKKLELSLERATAPRSQAENELDSEMASLRAGWLALDELLDAAQPEIQPPIAAMPLQPAKYNSRRLLTVVGALAASVLVAVLCKNLKPTAPDTAAVDTKVSAVAQNEPASSLPKTDTPLATAENALVKEKTPVLNSTEIAWNDSIDQQVELAGLAIQMARSDQLALGSSPSRAEYQIQSIRSDIENNSL